MAIFLTNTFLLSGDKCISRPIHTFPKMHFLMILVGQNNTPFLIFECRHRSGGESEK